MFEFKVDENFYDIGVNDTIETFLRNGYVLVLTPIKYSTHNVIMFEVKDVDESFQVGDRCGHC